MALIAGGTRLEVSGQIVVAERASEEYERIYERFAVLIDERASDADGAPLKLALDALARGEKRVVARSTGESVFPSPAREKEMERSIPPSRRPRPVIGVQRSISEAMKARRPAGSAIQPPAPRRRSVELRLHHGIIERGAQCLVQCLLCGGGASLCVNMAFQTITLKSGTPASALVGTSGRRAARLSCAMASVLIVPARGLRRDIDALVAEIIDLPADEVIHGGGRAAIGNAVRLHADHGIEEQAGRVAHRADARVGIVGGGLVALSQSTSSLRLLTGSDLRVLTKIGLVLTSPTCAKSSTGL